MIRDTVPGHYDTENRQYGSARDLTARNTGRTDFRQDSGPARAQGRNRNRKDASSLRVLLSWAAAAVLVLVFELVYNHFGHGVHSRYMNLAFVWPAAGFLISLAARHFGRLIPEGRVFLSSGIATLTIGFILQGVFEIAGTNSPYIPVFFIAGGILTVAAVLMFCIPLPRGKH